MDYKSKELFIKKIQAPILCKIGDDLEEFANGTELAEAALKKTYEIMDIRVLDKKIVLSLREKKGYTSLYDDELGRRRSNLANTTI